VNNKAIVYIQKQLDEGSSISTSINFINVEPEEAHRRFLEHEDVKPPSDWEQQIIEFNDTYTVFGNPMHEFNTKLEEAGIEGFIKKNLNDIKKE